MFIYHLTRQGKIERDENSALVLIAASEKDARHRAATLCGDEGGAAWLLHATCNMIGMAFADIDPALVCIDRLEA